MIMTNQSTDILLKYLTSYLLSNKNCADGVSVLYITKNVLRFCIFQHRNIYALRTTRGCDTWLSKMSSWASDWDRNQLLILRAFFSPLQVIKNTYVYPNLNCYGDNVERKVWSSCGSTYCTWFA
jgi:hypothetical protein